MKRNKLNECGCGCGGTSSACMEKDDRPDHYMFFGNLQSIRRAIDVMLQMDPKIIDELLADGHDWAADHIATSKDDIEEVAGFLMNQMEVPYFNKEEKIKFGANTFESFRNKLK